MVGFEETGVLLARYEVTASDASAVRNGGVRVASAGDAADSAAGAGELARWRNALLANDATLLDVLGALRLRPDFSRMVYCSHWITPVAEPKRYDTRFFLAELPRAAEVTIDEREMSDVAWLTARDALDAFRRGRLPMVFPTVKTIQRLEAYGTVDDMLDAFREGDVPVILPRLVRTDEGIGIVVDDYR